MSPASAFLVHCSAEPQKLAWPAYLSTPTFPWAELEQPKVGLAS